MYIYSEIYICSSTVISQNRSVSFIILLYIYITHFIYYYYYIRDLSKIIINSFSSHILASFIIINKINKNEFLK